MSSNPLIGLHGEGVSPWLDNLSRDMFRTGRLARLISEDGIQGQTSNPTIFQKAISQGQDYDARIRALASEGLDGEAICWELMIEDVREACGVFTPLFERSGGDHGQVSLELNPTLAHDTEGSLRQARALWPRVASPNLFIKVPATPEGIPVISTLLAEGMNVNVTLLFAGSTYRQVMEAYLEGLERRLEAGGALQGVRSVASFFVSRVDTEADRRFDRLLLEDPSRAEEVAGLRGRVAVANAQAAYGLFEEIFAGPRWGRLQDRGARVQRPLWASTGTKNPSYRDTLYVEELIGPHCVNTMPDETLEAFRHHGVVRRTLTAEALGEARALLDRVTRLGQDLEEMTTGTLVREGVEKFADSYRDLVGAVAAEAEKLTGRP